jgi:hypothetical protein
MLRLIRTRVVPFLISVIATVGLGAAGCDNDSKGGKLQTNSRGPGTPNSEIEIQEPEVTAEERTEALKVIDQAIKAHGGAERLGKIKAVVIKTQGWAGPVAEQFAAEQDLSMQFPDRVRNSFTKKSPEGNIEIALALDGETGWYQGPPGLTQIEKGSAIANEVKTDIFLESMAIKLPVKGEVTIVRPLPEARINGKAARGVQVKQKGWPKVAMYFDADSGLLVKLAAQVTEAGQSVFRETYYLDHKPVDGVMLPSRIRVERYGLVSLEWLSVQYQLPDKIDEALLKHPKG